MRAVLDTNILCSALLTPGGLTDRLYRAWREGRFELLTSEEQLEEFRRVTRYPRLRPFIEPAAAGARAVPHCGQVIVDSSTGSINVLDAQCSAWSLPTSWPV
jgi:predicted nucleic acid-binding protein